MGMILMLLTMDMMLMRFSIKDDHGTDNEIRVSNAVSDGYDDVTWTLEIWVPSRMNLCCLRHWGP